MLFEVVDFGAERLDRFGIVLLHPEPNLEEARLAFERVVSEGHRAAHIITGIRAMFRKDLGDRSPVAVNELVCDVVSTSLGELKSRRVSLALQLLDDLSAVQADRVQLQHVLLNLFANAVDSMASVTDRPDSCSVCVPSISRIGSLLVSKIPGRGSLPSTPKECSTRSSRPNQMALGWVCLSAELHGGQRFFQPIRTAEYFKSCYLGPLISLIRPLNTEEPHQYEAEQAVEESAALGKIGPYLPCSTLSLKNPPLGIAKAARPPTSTAQT